ncbi:MAG TPA: hypothetical protein VGB25_03715 [Candidatus Binatia bacterium]
MRKLTMAVMLSALLAPAAALAHDGFAGVHDGPRFTPKPPYVRYGGYIRKRVDEHGRIVVYRHGRRIVYPRDWHWFSRYRPSHRVHDKRFHGQLR